MSTPQPKRKIGLLSCIIFAIGTMIGGGVFVLSGTVVSIAGPAALLSYALAGLTILLSALSFASVSSRAEAGNSGYWYVGVALSPVFLFLTQWAFYVMGAISVAFVLQAFGSYFTQYFFPTLNPLLIAILAAIVLTLLNFGPAYLVARAEGVIVGLKLLILLIFIFFGFLHIGQAQFIPFMPHGIGSVLSSAAMLFIAYLGFNVITNMANEIDRPQHTIPLAILLSVLIVALVYLGVVFAILASGAQDLGTTGIGAAANALMGPWGGMLIALAACLSTFSGANANIIGNSEIMIRMSADGEVPTYLGKLSRRGHPIVSVLMVTIIATILILTGRIDIIIDMANVSAIVAMLLINLAALHATFEKDLIAGAIRLPLGPILPILGALTCVLQLPLLGWIANSIGILMILAGLLLYLPRARFVRPHHQDALQERIEQGHTPAQRALQPGMSGPPAPAPDLGD